ncbi:hypothetical protein AUK04_02390 [Candidatus Roizmanbacteria bacterium CG2_30_33_16]|uniref:Uncharacterized protein n=3 Tax=Candidatus Roizmaniibacteriota TaxID=1752723 RepID=A0A2M7E3V0_9BACT|nr:MAG: hypothetical protein AUK04_02390 [Candidatus Roizmanbacteria bacterium CG2_30_33_16]PIV62410.1 MAG: hypothetical protein COS12_02525 [Candidatus Roizmanbacteria bacterium CG01_land_8_20_14_3_00_33_9]PJB88892.1 MAG: hypothetical protein CO083_01675 [Candidatus Roizmanbacteria bacterium CG_4_9_14_0_8_um_filter_34_12]
MINKYFSYYKRGVQLLNKNIVIYFVGLLIFILPQLDTIIGSFGIHIGLFITIVKYIFSILIFGSIFLSITTLNDAFNKQTITALSIWNNYKKTFVKSIKIMLLLTFFAMVWFGLINSPQRPLLPKAFAFLPSLISVLLFPITTYFGIYLAIENNSFVDSIKNSVVFYLNNFSFTLLSIIYGLINRLILSSELFVLKTDSIFYYVYEVVIIYFSLIISAAFLIYFKEINQQKSGNSKIPLTSN